MRIPHTTFTSSLSISILATAVILLAAPLAANAGGTVRDHRTPPTVNDHRQQVRDHKDDAFWP
jgi:hypothetical protein